MYRSKANKRYIVHVDMDAFFAAIEQRDNPLYRSKPVVVGSDPKGGKGRGVVSTCSYEAREYGIHSAMPISTAYRKCPSAIFLPVDFVKYEAASRRIYEIFYSFTPDVEPVSIDEAFLDITGSHHLFGTPFETCLILKNRIKEKMGLTASVGLAPIKLAAKIASDLKKPDGMVEVTEKGLSDFLRPLEVRRIWGLGGKSEETLHSMGIKTIGDLAESDPRQLARAFGKTGEYFWQLANGIDDREVLIGHEIKSVSNEITFDEDTQNSDMIDSSLLSLCEKVSSRLRSGCLKSRTVTLKIRLEGFLTYTRAHTLPDPTNFADILYKQVKDLYNKFDLKRKKVRLVGVKASNLSASGIQTSLFVMDDEKKTEAVHAALDSIKEKFGDSSIYRAGARSIKE